MGETATQRGGSSRSPIRRLGRVPNEVLILVRGDRDWGVEPTRLRRRIERRIEGTPDAFYTHCMQDLQQTSLDELIFVGFNRRVVALDRYSGALRWDWKATKGSGFVSLLIDGDRLIANCQGYTWCLDPLTGGEVWFQPLKGLGTGFASLASVRGGSASIDAGAAASQAAAASATAAGAAT